MSSPDQEPPVRVPVGDPLHRADARFLQYELKKLGIACKVRACKEAATPHSTHVVEVDELDLESAVRIRRELIEENDELDEDVEAQPAASRLVRLVTGPYVLGILGAVAGIRVASKLGGSPWSIISITLLFVVISSGLGYVLRYRPLPPPPSQGDDPPPESAEAPAGFDDDFATPDESSPT